MLSIDGGDPLIKRQLEGGLDWTISSVAGESYRVDVSRAFWLRCLFHCVICSFSRGIVFFLVRLT